MDMHLYNSIKLAVSNDKYRPQLHSVHITDDYCIATNGHLLHYAKNYQFPENIIENFPYDNCLKLIDTANKRELGTILISNNKLFKSDIANLKKLHNLVKYCGKASPITLTHDEEGKIVVTYSGTTEIDRLKSKASEKNATYEDDLPIIYVSFTTASMTFTDERDDTKLPYSFTLALPYLIDALSMFSAVGTDHFELYQNDTNTNIHLKALLPQGYGNYGALIAKYTL